MSLGRYVSDLEPGDVLEPVDFEITPYFIREYCHSVELHQECFQGLAETLIAPVSLLHPAKLMLCARNCPQGSGPSARLHYSFAATFGRFVRVGEKVRTSSEVTDRYENRGREYLRMRIDLHSIESGELLMSYIDTSLLAYTPKKEEVTA